MWHLLIGCVIGFVVGIFVFKCGRAIKRPAGTIKIIGNYSEGVVVRLKINNPDICLKKKYITLKVCPDEEIPQK